MAKEARGKRRIPPEWAEDVPGREVQMKVWKMPCWRPPQVGGTDMEAAKWRH